VNNQVDYVARIIAILTLVLGVGAFAYEHLRGPALRASTGKYVYIQGRPRLGISVGFFNNGAEAAIINTSTLTLDDGSHEFPFTLTLFSPSTEKWTTEGGSLAPIPATYSLFSQLAVKPGDTADGVFWYSPDPAFKFIPDKKYVARLTFSSVDQEQTGASVVGKTPLCTSGTTFTVDSTVAKNAQLDPQSLHVVKTD